MTQTATFVKDTATVRNGVDTTTMFATLDAIKAQPEIAKFQFRGSAASSSVTKNGLPPVDAKTRRPAPGSPASCVTARADNGSSS
jgi:hypothetical protein